MSRSSARLLIFAVGALALIVPALMVPQGLTDVELYGYALRVTARVTFAFFILAYVARPLVRLFKWGQWLVRNRRYLGIMVAVSHTVHFVYVWLYFAETGEPLDAATIVFGGLGFVLFWVMGLTSNNASVRLLGPWWRRIHRFGMHYNWVIFLITYAPMLWAWPIVVAAGALRFAAWIKLRRRVQPDQPQ